MQDRTRKRLIKAGVNQVLDGDQDEYKKPDY